MGMFDPAMFDPVMFETGEDVSVFQHAYAGGRMIFKLLAARWG